MTDPTNRLSAALDVAPDGRFIMARHLSGAGESDAPIIVVENWFEDLKMKVGK